MFDKVLTTPVVYYYLNVMQYACLRIIDQQQKQSSEVSYKKDALQNFKKFTLKHLCQSLFVVFTKIFAKFLRKSFFTEHLTDV